MAGAKKFINDPSNVIYEMIQGLVETYPHLQYLDGFPEVKVVLRADAQRGEYDKVSIISGGGSGHEPAHAGYVGRGMLTAAVCGDLFASPTVDAILAAIRAVTGPQGCLLIVKNYTGDRLNFGLAAEQAKEEGFKVETVIVGDDCALPPPRGVAGRRGLAGTLFVHKVAGAAAEAGADLAKVAAEARHVAALVGTMGVGLSVGTLPGGLPSQRLGPSKMELGLGIHGEPGAAVVDVQPADVIVAHLLKQILDPKGYLPAVKLGSRVALMVNNLGATSGMEIMIAGGKAVAQLQVEHGVGVERVFAGTLMTSLDMAGLSLSVLKVDDSILARLDAPTLAPAWPPASAGPRPPTTMPAPLPPKPADEEQAAPVQAEQMSVEGQMLAAAIRGGAEAVLDLRGPLNEWDTRVGDGDTGTTMGKGATAVLADLSSSYPVNDAVATVKALGATIRRTMGGTIGVLYDLFCRAAYVELRKSKTKGSGACTPMQWAAALEAGVAAVELYGGAKAGYRTMLDAFIPASTCLQERLKAGDSPAAAFSQASQAAAVGAEATKAMLAQAGRSSYVPPEVLRSVPDPGAMAAAAWLKGVASALAAQTSSRG